MKIFLTLTSLLLASSLFSQVTVNSMSLPDIGDELSYTIFSEYQDTVSYRMSGENMEWTFDGFNATNSQTEVYTDISTTSLADSFPDANMLLEFGGFESAALKTDSSLSLIGVVVNDFTGFGVEANVILDEGFTIRKTPFSFGDKIDDAFSVFLGIDATTIPGLDSLDLGFPGATLDSIRVTTDISKTEEAIGWGTVNILGQSIEALQIIQEDNTSTTIELGILFFGNRLWLNAADIFGDMLDTFGGDQSSITYKYLSADNKRSIVEFTENRVSVDTLGNTMLLVDGRTSAEFLSPTEELSLNQAAFTIYPNPVTDLLHFTFEEERDIEYISIYDTTGKLQRTSTHHTNGQSISVQDLPEGFYFLHIKTQNLETVKKFQVIK